MKKAAALGSLLLVSAPSLVLAQEPEPRWTASVPLWKVLTTKGELVAVQPGPSWLDSRGPVIPAARLGTVSAIETPESPKLPPLPKPTLSTPPARVHEAVLPMPREVPKTLPLELRDDVDVPALPPTKGPSLMGPSLGPLPTLQPTSGTVGPDLVLPQAPPPLPVGEEATEETEFATERVVRAAVRPVPTPTTPKFESVTPEVAALVPVAMRVSPLLFPVRPKLLPTPTVDKYLSPYHPIRHLEPLTAAAGAARLALPLELVD